MNQHKDRDQVILEHILAKDNLNHAESHLGNVSSTNELGFVNPDIAWQDTEKFRVAMIIAPAWGVLFPPYNLAKLTGNLRHFGYSTKVYDLNIESYHTVNKDYWRGENFHVWVTNESFDNEILPLLKPLFDKTINDIVKANPRVIGFSLYNTNLLASKYIVNELKRLLPNSCFIAGGPEVMSGNTLSKLPFNYLFIGEAEETLISVLEELPDEYPTRLKIGTTDSKLNLEKSAFPDYSDYNLKNYQHPDGASIETSRGCVAECSFCSETYFWKFRSRTPEQVVEEMEHQINNYGISRFWFVDSLVNGNLKNFRRLVDLILEKKLKIQWNSYARCDGRMDKEFIQKIAESGCTCISYGVESGSQKVLTDMRKKIDIWEVESNLKHGQEVGLFNHVNWIIGFPTEEPIDFLHSLQLLANARTHIGAISPGFGAGPVIASHMYTDWKTYNIAGQNAIGDGATFLDAWYTLGYKNTILNRFIRIKLLHVWLDILANNSNSTIINSQRYYNIEEFYTFSTKNTCKEYESPDEFAKLEFNGDVKFEDIISNEYLSIMVGLFKYFGGFNLTIQFDPVKDSTTFGSWIVNDYTCQFSVNVEDNGDYHLILGHALKHIALDEGKKVLYEQERSVEDKTFSQSIIKQGNIRDFVSDVNQVKETVHVQYRKKVIPITNLRSDV